MDTQSHEVGNYVKTLSLPPPTSRTATFSLGPGHYFFFFFALITTVLGSCWNRAVGLATVEDLSQRVEAMC